MDEVGVLAATSAPGSDQPSVRSHAGFSRVNRPSTLAIASMSLAIAKQRSVSSPSARMRAATRPSTPPVAMNTNARVA